MFGERTPRRGPMSEERYANPASMREVNRAQQENRDAHFHGACHGCAWKKGNNQGAGLLWCMECTYFDWNPAKRNLRLNMPTVDTVLPEDF